MRSDLLSGGALKRWTGSALVSMCLALGSASGVAEGSYPAHPIRLVVGFPQGGGVDLVAREFAAQLSLELDQAVSVENVAGEAGNKASAEVARAKPDGYTVLVVNPANMAINPTLYPSLDFDPLVDFVPVARMVETPLLALIPVSLSPQRMEEFITRVRTQRSLRYASGGVGNINHLAVELFKMRTGTRLVHAPAANSSAALTELLAARVQFMVDGAHVAGEHIREGRLRALAVFGDARLNSFPDVPTAAETGISDLVVSSWIGLVVPAGTPTSITIRLQEAVAAALSRPEFSKKLESRGIQPALLLGDAFREFVQIEQTRWAEVIKGAGVKLE